MLHADQPFHGPHCPVGNRHATCLGGAGRGTSGAELSPQVVGGEQTHGTRKFGVHGMPGERTEPSYERGRLGRVGVGRRARAVEVAVEDVLGGELQET